MTFLRRIKALFLFFIRNALWKLLGSDWLTANQILRPQILSSANWVERGENSYDNGALVWRWSNHEALRIGKYCSIAYGVQFLCGDGHHDKDLVTTSPLLRRFYKKDEIVTILGRSQIRKKWDEEMAVSKGPIIVGNDVWIGQNAIILSGVKIDNGAMVLAGSVVTKNVDPYSIVGGVPARVVGQRFPADQIDQLLRIAWWDWPEVQIKERIADFYDMEKFLILYGSHSAVEPHE